MQIPPYLLDKFQSETKAKASENGGLDVFPDQSSERSFHLYGFDGPDMQKAACEIASIEALNGGDISFIFMARCKDRSIARIEDRKDNPCSRRAIEEHLKDVEIEWVLPSPDASKPSVALTMLVLAGLSLVVTGAVYGLLLASLG